MTGRVHSSWQPVLRVRRWSFSCSSTALQGEATIGSHKDWRSGKRQNTKMKFSGPDLGSTLEEVVNPYRSWLKIWRPGRKKAYRCLLCHVTRKTRPLTLKHKRVQSVR